MNLVTVFDSKYPSDFEISVIFNIRPISSSLHSAAKHHVSAPQLLGKPVVGSLRKTHLWDIYKKLIKRFFGSY